jgi:hypothetical protein
MRLLELTKKIPLRDRSNYSTEVRTTEDLYLDHKKKNEKLHQLKRSVDNERGITFKPKVTASKNIAVTSSFEERNSRVLEYKRLLHQLGSSPQSYSNKKYSQEEIIENNKRVVERLYHKDLEKVLSKKYGEMQEECSYNYVQANPYGEAKKVSRLMGHMNTDQLTFQIAQNTDSEQLHSMEGEYIDVEDEGQFNEEFDD